MASTRPTEADIARLPFWARVAFAVRCARRLSSLLDRGALAHQEILAIAEAAIGEAEVSCEYGVSSERLAEVAELADNAHVIAQDHDHVLPAMVAAVSCWTAKAAQYPSLAATGAAYGASAAAQRYGCDAVSIYADYERVAGRVNSRPSDDDSPVSVDVFGPLSSGPEKKATS